MFWKLMDYEKFSPQKLLNRDKIDPGTFSFLEPGWWALHATAITAVYALGCLMNRKKQNQSR